MSDGPPHASTAPAATDPARVGHAIGRDDWALVGEDDDVRPESLAEEGFIHLSTPEQIAQVCNERFAGRTDLLLLVVDPRALPAPLVWEDSYGAGEVFPHLYAPLPRTALIDVIDYQPIDDGRFTTPALR